MTAIALKMPPLHTHWLSRALIAGAAWGVLVTSGLTAMSFAECGGACIDTVAMTGATTVLAGILTLGPLAAFRR